MFFIIIDTEDDNFSIIYEINGLFSVPNYFKTVQAIYCHTIINFVA